MGTFALSLIGEHASLLSKLQRLCIILKLINTLRAGSLLMRNLILFLLFLLSWSIWLFKMLWVVLTVTSFFLWNYFIWYLWIVNLKSWFTIRLINLCLICSKDFLICDLLWFFISRTGPLLSVVCVEEFVELINVKDSSFTYS